MTGFSSLRCSTEVQQGLCLSTALLEAHCTIQQQARFIPPEEWFVAANQLSKDSLKDNIQMVTNTEAKAGGRSQIGLN